MEGSPKRVSGVALGVAAVLFLVVVLGLSVAVGYAAPRKAFDWTVASVFGTALGTTLLAMATGAPRVFDVGRCAGDPGVGGVDEAGSG